MVSIRSVLVVLMFPVVAIAQQYDPSAVSKKSRVQYEKAMQLSDEGNYAEALRIIDQVLQKEPRYLDAMLSKAGLLGELKNYKEAVRVYQSAFAMDSLYTRTYFLPYSINLMGMGAFGDALAAVNRFLEIPGLNASFVKAGEYRKKTALFAIEQAQRYAQHFDPQFSNLGAAVNSAELEYFPSLTIDGKQLIYTRRVNGTNEDFFSSKFEDAVWKPSQALPGTVNTPFSEGAQQISQDGKWLVFTGCLFPQGLGSCDIYISFLTPQGWSRPQNLDEPVNSEFWDSSPCLSPDKQELYFSSNRPGGYGGSDIYVSRRMANGRWSTPQNLGPLINTPGDEKAPFMHADNETLYFTTDGLQGYGGTDLFFSRRRSNGFDTAVNLGYPINTIDNEGSLVVASDGIRAFFASDRPEGLGGLDIYSFLLREPFRPLASTWVEGRVYDSLSGAGVAAIIELIDLKTKRMVMQVQADAEGNYLTSLPMGRDYAFNVNKKGYLFYSGRFSLQQTSQDSHYTRLIPLQPLVKGANVVLKNILFETGKHDLLPASVVELEKMMQVLKDNPRIRVQINGHTDNVGKDADNVLLSAARAKSVVDYLISSGISPERLSYKGFGASLPVADNATEEGRALNRRTEMVVLSAN